MAIQKLVCSNCRGDLVWNPDDRTFVCGSCGSKFQTDNEFTYRYVDEAEVEKVKLERDKARGKFKDDLKYVLLVFGAIILFPLLFKLMLLIM